MRPFLLLLISAFVYSLAGAQEIRRSPIKRIIRVKDLFSFSDIYLFPSFDSGVVIFRNNRSVFDRMNYNRFTKEINVISEKDTLALANPETSKSVEIGKNIFYYQADIGYIQYLMGTSEAAFGKMEQIQNNRIIHYFDTPRNPPVRHYDISYSKKTTFYFANKNGFFLIPTKKNITEIFPKKKEIINAYLKEHRVDFDNEESLRNLFKAITEQR